MTPYAALLDRTRTNPGQPFLTYVVPSTGERMELSANSFLNAAAKAAGLLRDELDVEPGDRVGIRLPCHWQRAVWWAACTLVGAVYAADATERVTVASREQLSNCADAEEVVLVSLAAFGLPDGQPTPAGIVEAAVAARIHPDEFIPYDVPASDWEVLPGRSAAQVMQQAADLADARGVHPGARFAVLCGDSDIDLLQCAVPLVSGGSVVLIDASADDISGTLESEGASLTE